MSGPVRPSDLGHDGPLAALDDEQIRRLVGVIARLLLRGIDQPDADPDPDIRPEVRAS